MSTQFNNRKARTYTVALLDMAEEGLIDWESLARDALGWMDENDVEHFARQNAYIRDDEGEGG